MTHRTGKVLIVDDEEDTAMLVSDGLRRWGHETAYVTSGAQCLEHMCLEPVDVVITDVQMPDMSGIELCEQLRERHPECSSIVLTGHATGDIAIQASRAGAFDFLLKPARIAQLDTAIGRALGQPKHVG